MISINATKREGEHKNDDVLEVQMLTIGGSMHFDVGVRHKSHCRTVSSGGQGR